ncbi:D-alanyl-D-alanine carboxypeptidase family protein [Heyndrickxia coagulans]|uniref:D-alanyl-D-alanine carboxypeptidase n=1 Tax=Heyndrickxia coagulans DSM 1 = ATCC 7050 TaxID=1121088 RepID=A0A8B4BSA0_HEYCO|nr:M15 family metallopeptidase [Heyndrickxia coagulans]AJH78532.1 D-alanyl-D-alanine carboxypeptidase family protein [Heyndrickxia coagulans DSM 1 = ATCC 7050]MCR2845159.1 M15 family metallopeptidase [Heyndrickxia coagulans]MDR4222856.1 M15 family metallopeptidase [Heyndrickxia coagulans DSM 1 = ATCC 7050]MED4492815.1 M15 family metallopeptidase [Heyndrickxia coagulans]MED4537013.1 M15 family metallopeptidase [Heyndrickxia coagulans]
MRKYVYTGLAAIFLAGCSVTNGNEPETGAHKSTAPAKPVHTDTAKKTGSGLVLDAKYFNKIKTVNGKKVIQNPDNILALVNKTYILGDYKPKDLVRPNVRFSFGDERIEKSYMRKEAAAALEKMFAAAEKDGIELYAASAYRSYNRQKAVYAAEVKSSGEEHAEQAVAIPGSSEHQTGLAVDITSQTAHFLLTQQMGEQKEGIWLAKHAHEYGFILRYPKNKENITKYEYEPWHFRYVGKKAAAVIYKHGWTLEEYFEHVHKAE